MTLEEIIDMGRAQIEIGRALLLDNEEVLMVLAAAKRSIKLEKENKILMDMVNKEQGVSVDLIHENKKLEAENFRLRKAWGDTLYWVRKALNILERAGDE